MSAWTLETRLTAPAPSLNVLRVYFDNEGKVIIIRWKTFAFRLLSVYLSNENTEFCKTVRTVSLYIHSLTHRLLPSRYGTNYHKPICGIKRNKKKC